LPPVTGKFVEWLNIRAKAREAQVRDRCFWHLEILKFCRLTHLRVSGFYPPKSGIKIGCNIPQLWAQVSPQFLTQVFPSWAPSLSREKVFIKGVVYPVKNRGKVKNRGSFVKSVVCPVKIGGKFWSATLSNLPPPLFFTGRKLCPPGIGIEATAQSYEASHSVICYTRDTILCPV